MRAPLTLAFCLAASAALAQGYSSLPSITETEQIQLPIAAGPQPAGSGACAIKTQIGGMMAGGFTANGACSSSTVILTFAYPAPAGRFCGTRDLTTPANAMNETAYTATTVTFTGTMANNDQVLFHCFSF